MKRTLLTAAAAIAASVAAPAGAADAPAAVSNGIVYTVEAHNSALAAACVFVADRWTADYGPTTVYAVAESATAIWTHIRCTVSKNGTTYVDAEATTSGPVARINGARKGTIPVAGLTICVYAEAQSSVDSHPVVSNCDPA